MGGQRLSPQLAWTAPPEGTAELLLVAEDTGAPAPRPFVHGVALIEPAVRELPSGYLGPEPIRGHGPHHYTFQLFALGAVLARGRLTGVYER